MIKKMITTLTSEEWDEKFIPIMDGESYKDFHPKIVNDDEKKVLEEVYGKEWYKKWDFTKEDLTEIVTVGNNGTK